MCMLRCGWGNDISICWLNIKKRSFKCSKKFKQIFSMATTHSFLTCTCSSNPHMICSYRLKGILSLKRYVIPFQLQTQHNTAVVIDTVASWPLPESVCHLSMYLSQWPAMLLMTSYFVTILSRYPILFCKNLSFVDMKVDAVASINSG